MRILLTSPFAHPYVRRGVERYVGELAGWLARSGHDVRVLTTAPDRSRVETRADGESVQYVRSGRPFRKGPVHLDELWRTLPSLALATVPLVGYDVVEAHHFPDAVVLGVAGRLGRPPYSLWLPGVPRASYFVGHRVQRSVVGAVMRGARLRLSLSRHAADVLRRDFGLDSEVLPPGVDTSLYAGPRPGGDPVVLCAAAADDPRKRVDVLVAAFERVAARRSDARLVLAPPRPGPAVALLAGLDPQVRARAEVTFTSGSEELAALYRRAAVSVLPSLDEAFGLVLVESLAAGTPVVGTRHGAIPDVVRDDGVGRLAPPDDPDGLAAAILEALDLAEDPGTADACRAWARQWDWQTIGPRWLELVTGGAAVTSGDTGSPAHRS